MKVKPHLKTLKRMSFMHKDEMAGLRNFDGLDCHSGGSRKFGVPQRVLDFIKNYDWRESVLRGSDAIYSELKREICNFWSTSTELEPDQIKLGSGSMQVLERINKLFIRKQSKVLGYAPQFTEYVTELIMNGASYRGVPLSAHKKFRFEANKFLEEIRCNICLAYIDNPNNPTGQVIKIEEIEAIAKEAKKRGVVLVIDEAYADYTENSAMSLLGKFDNVIVTRTFTKGYQLTGIRVGYGVFPRELSKYYDKIDLPFPIPVLGSCLAREAILDTRFISDLRKQIALIKDRLMLALRNKGYILGESSEQCPIFVLGHKDVTVDLKRHLLSKGILTTSGMDFRNLGKHFVRVRITRPSAAENFLYLISN
jgi:histidinol-phosphate aminotransferase